MKKTILILALSAISFTTFAQSTKKDTTKVDSILHFNIDKAGALEFLKGLEAGYKAAKQSDVVSGKSASQAETDYYFFLQLVYKKWLDLIPKK